MLMIVLNCLQLYKYEELLSPSEMEPIIITKSWQIASWVVERLNT